MTFTRACLSFALLLAGCAPDLCASAACGAGSVCSPDDGLCHCASPEGPVCAGGEACDAAIGECFVPLPAPVCRAGTRWTPGTIAFREATDEWGLAALRVEGTRLSVTDIDGDGWADLEVRRGTLGVEDFSSPEGRRTWLLRNTGEGRFEDVTERSGFLARRHAAEGGGRPVQIVAWADVDNDGDLDAYSGLDTDDWEAVGMEVSEILLNDGTGRFTLGPADNPVRVTEDVDIPAGASFVDVDRDGFVDLWIPQHNSPSGVLRQNRLWRGDGTGRFTDATEALGLVTEDWIDQDVISMGLGHTRSWSAHACDLNGDGWPELLASSYGRSPNQLWQARPSDAGLRYENRSVASGYAYDEDRSWTDNQFARCFCQANPSAEDCAGVPPPLIACAPNWNHETDRSPWRLGGNSGATLCGDLDNDGDLDLFTTEIKHWWAGSGADGSEVLVNDGAADPVFSRPGDEALGLAIDHTSEGSWDEGHMTGAILDFDNDGWPDIYLGASDYPGNYGRLYHQQSALAFVEVPPSEGIDHHRSHGVVAADFDRDGDLDLIVGHSRARCGEPNDCYPTMQVRFFENLAGDEGSFLQLKLEGAGGTNRAAIGARVSVTAGGITQTQEVSGGHGHYGSQRDLVLHFGLGAACEAHVEVRWPDAALTTETFTLPAGHRIHIRQGERPRLAP